MPSPARTLPPSSPTWSRSVGFWLLCTAALHTAVGLGVGWPWVVDIVRDGVVGAVEPEPMRMALFWFLAFGVPVAIVGGLVWELERAGRVVPRWLGVALVALGVAGGLAIPASGFWLVVPQGLVVVARGARRRPVQ